MSLLLDTVTISALREPARCPPSVAAWAQLHSDYQFYLSVMSLNEIRFGIRMVEHRDPSFAKVLLSWYTDLAAQPMDLPLVNVDSRVAETAADFRYHHKMSYNDSLIAATAEVHELTLATRNVKDFERCGIKLLNPWDFAE